MAVGAFVNSFVLMELSRVVFGIGGESLAVAQNTYASAWFRGKALNMVFGFQLSIARVGAYANFLSVGAMYRSFKEGGDVGTAALGWTFAVSGISTILSLLAAVIVGILDKRRARIWGQDLQAQEEVYNSGYFGAGEAGYLKLDKRSAPIILSLIIVYFQIHIKDVRKFPVTFWLVTIICVAFYVTIFPFISQEVVFLQTKFGLSEQDAAFWQGITAYIYMYIYIYIYIHA